MNKKWLKNGLTFQQTIVHGDHAFSAGGSDEGIQLMNFRFPYHIAHGAVEMHSLRQAPDVILLGEMRDYETIRTAMTAAETGHLVIMKASN